MKIHLTIVACGVLTLVGCPRHHTRPQDGGRADDASAVSPAPPTGRPSFECLGASDCESRVCDDGRCVPPRCDDGVRNGDETSVDCGGSCGRCPACEADAECATGLCRGGRCVGSTCADGEVNGDETGVDCGGSCAPCEAGEACFVSTDCRSEVCEGHRCQPPRCDDGVSNQDEADVDCGGATCPACPAGSACRSDADCANLDCAGSRCASCTDGARNQGESDVDCGGTCPGCEVGRTCTSDEDCVTRRCDRASGTCASPPGCPGTTGLHVGHNEVAWERLEVPAETVPSCAYDTARQPIDHPLSFTASVDGVVEYRVEKTPYARMSVTVGEAGCGTTSALVCDELHYGPVLEGSFPVRRSAAYRIWVSGYVGHHDARHWSSPLVIDLRERDDRCTDGVLGGDESDVDCGGSVCPGCLAEETCAVDADCHHQICRGGACRPIGCGNGVLDFEETDVDCGGGSCVTCGVGRSCRLGSDCASGACVAGRCAAPTCSDGVRNDGESGVDCGGATTCPRCPGYATCTDDSDCDGGSCVDALCRAPTSPACDPLTAGATDAFGYRGCITTLPVAALPCPTPSSAAPRISINPESDGLYVPLPFDFDYYGRRYDAVNLFMSGTLAFDAGPTPRSPLATCDWPPSAAVGVGYGGPTELVAPLWRYDWGVNLTHEIVGQAPHRRLVVRWERDVDFAAAPFEYSAVLHEDTGDIDFCYASVEWGGATPAGAVGIAHGGSSTTPATGLLHSCGPPDVQTGSFIRMRHP